MCAENDILLSSKLKAQERNWQDWVKVVKMNVSSKVRMINTLKDLNGFLWQGE